MDKFWPDFKLFILIQNISFSLVNAIGWFKLQNSNEKQQIGSFIIISIFLCAGSIYTINALKIFLGKYFFSILLQFYIDIVRIKDDIGNWVSLMPCLQLFVHITGFLGYMTMCYQILFRHNTVNFFRVNSIDWFRFMSDFLFNILIQLCIMHMD